MDEVNFCTAMDCLVVNVLSTVLKDVCKSQNISQLTLSARCLQVLYEGFRHVQNSSCVKLSHTELEEKFFSSLTHLYDSVQNAKELKIFESGETLQGHVNCTDFLTISVLEVKCLPLYQLYGLSKVAHNLNTVTCIGCITRVQELFEQCGADAFRASDVLWSKLRVVHLAYNNLQTLDNSLRLVSQLCHLDLSHNNLSSTDNFLLVLHSLEVLNLSYNSLRDFPEISRIANRHLTHLNLRNNLLTSLNGLEHLFCLRYLDLSNNLLLSSKTLNNLKSLLLLQCLVLAGNPISFHPSYRKLIIGCLHPAVVSQINFDGHFLTKMEKFQFTQIQAASIDANSQLVSDFLESVEGSINSNFDSLSDTQRRIHRRIKPRLVKIMNQDDILNDSNDLPGLENSFDFSDTNRICSARSSSCTERDATSSERCDSGLRISKHHKSSRSSSSRRQRSSIKHSFSAGPAIFNEGTETDTTKNNIEISGGNRLYFVGSEDADNSRTLVQDKGDSIAGSPSMNICDKIVHKDLVAGVNEDCENSLASLKIAEDTHSGVSDASSIINCEEPLVSHNSSAVEHSTSLVGDSELSVEYVSGLINPAIENTYPVSGASESFSGSSRHVVFDCAQNPDAVVSNQSIAPVSPADTSTDAWKSSDAKICSSPSSIATAQPHTNQHHDFHLSRSLSNVVLSKAAQNHRNSCQDDVCGSFGSGDTSTAVAEDTTSEQNDMDGNEDVTLDSLIDNGFDGDFLIYLLAGARSMNADRYIVSVIDNWLYVRTAKDVVERLDLRGLLAVQKVADLLSQYVEKQETKISIDASFRGPVVRLLFDTFRQDNHERLFSMKNQFEGKQLARLLKSFIKSKSSKKMQCLRCDFHFDESDGRVGNKDFSIKDANMVSNLKAGHNTLHCPKCDSHFVIEVVERTGVEIDKEGLTLSMKSQTKPQLDRGQPLAGNKTSRKHRKHRKQNRGGITQLSSSVAQTNTGSPSAFLSFLRRRNTTDQSLVLNENQRTAADSNLHEKFPDDMSAVEAVQFYIDPSEE